MQSKTLFLALIAIALSAAGQLFLKAGAQHLIELTRLRFFIEAARDPRVIAGIAAWTVSTLCWLYVLRAAPLSKAYALTSLTYVLVLLGGVFLYGEHVRRTDVAGTLLIMVGIACLLYGE